MKSSGATRIAAFYQFRPLSELERLRAEVERICEAHGVRGIVLLAPEGVNATIAAEHDRLPPALGAIEAACGLDPLSPRFSAAEDPPFRRLKVRIKTEIVTIGDPSVDPRERTGEAVDPADWDALIADPDMLLIDVRNSYEIAAGTFEGAIDPGTASFGDFPDWVRRNLDPSRHKRIAMFCTGGIRCEKASSFLLREGFADVRQLKGGILAYLACGASQPSRWNGGCFVFDERIAVGPGLEPLPIRLCLSCDAVLDAQAMAGKGYEEGVSCPRCVDRLTERQKASARERQRQVELAARRATAPAN